MTEDRCYFCERPVSYDGDEFPDAYLQNELSGVEVVLLDAPGVVVDAHIGCAEAHAGTWEMA